jgi:hypothetical protein
VKEEKPPGAPAAFAQKKTSELGLPRDRGRRHFSDLKPGIGARQGRLCARHIYIGIAATQALLGPFFRFPCALHVNVFGTLR